MRTLIFLAVLLITACDGGGNTYTSEQNKPDCDSLKGSSKIQAMNCK
jgi:hypothetical protein